MTITREQYDELQELTQRICMLTFETDPERLRDELKAIYAEQWKLCDGIMFPNIKRLLASNTQMDEVQGAFLESQRRATQYQDAA